MKKYAVYLLLVASLLLGACAARAPQTSTDYAQPGVPQELSPAIGLESKDAQDASAGGQPTAPGAGGQTAATDRLVIKNGYLSVVVKDPLASLAAISTMAEAMGGFVVSSNVYQTTAIYGETAQRINQASVTIRVPVDQLNAALEQIKAGATEVTSQNVTGQDVTQEYTDLQSQLKNLESAEAQLREIMASATKTEDVLAVFNQLVQVQGQIEVIKGQIQYYAQSAAFSSVSVDLIPDAANQPIEIGGWRPQGAAKAAVEALVRALQDLTDALIWIGIYVLPLALLVILPLYFIVRGVINRRRKKKAAITPSGS